jgi:glycosyltransferase involved in cell wall biosynthesis
MNVGIVIPTLGQNLYWLENALQSCRYDSYEYEIVVVCKEITAELSALCEKYKCKIVLEKSKGIFSAINDGVDYLRDKVELFSFIGDDDQLLPGAIRNLLQAFDDPQVMMAYGYLWYFDENSRILFCNPGYPKLHKLIAWIPDLIPHPGAVVRISAWEKLNGFDRQFKFAADLDFWIRLRKLGKLRHMKVPMAYFRWHENGQTAGQRSKSLEDASRVRKANSNKFARFIKNFTEPLITWSGERLKAIKTKRESAHEVVRFND